MVRMDPWDHIRKAVADTRSGSVQVAARAALGFESLATRRDVMRAARALLRAHPAMASLWRLCAAALDGPDEAAAYAEQLASATAASADATRWVVTKRNTVVLTHSASGSVVRALERVRGRISLVMCTASIPGGEGRGLARRLETAGFETQVVPDAGIARACKEADVALVGADAVTDEGVVNKVGTALVALGAREAEIGCYAVAASGKLVPSEVWRPDAAPAYESTPLELFDAIITERGAKRPGFVRRAAGRIELPDALLEISI
jgi:translation initiation factor 2B subunit (eIF-2B alpha/beta/delta family)